MPVHAAPPAVPLLAPPPRWAWITAHAVPLLTVPSGLWRLALGVGVPVGLSGELAAETDVPGWMTLYVVALSVLAEALALLTLGLVRPWGQVLPRWVPLVGGRRVPLPLAVALAGLGAVALVVLTVRVALDWGASGDPDEPQGVAALVLALCYAPLLAWGPLLAAVTANFAWRAWRAQRRPTDHRAHGDRGARVAQP